MPRAQKKFQGWGEVSEERRREILEGFLNSGFGSEVRARRVFAEIGLDAWTWHYIDKDLRKSREVDILSITTKRTPSFFFRYVCEVKSRCTWIAAEVAEGESDEPLHNAFRPSWYVRAEKDARRSQKIEEVEGIEEILLGENFPSMSHTSSLYNVNDGPGGKDHLHDAIVSVVKASNSVPYPKWEHRKDPDDILATIPMIVVDGNLLKFVDSDKGLELVPIDHVELVTRYSSDAYGDIFVSIHVLTLEHLPVFVQKTTELERAGQRLTESLLGRLRTTAQRNAEDP